MIRRGGDPRALEAMPGYGGEHRLHVFWNDHVAAREHRPGARGAHQALTGARTLREAFSPAPRGVPTDSGQAWIGLPPMLADAERERVFNGLS